MNILLKTIFYCAAAYLVVAMFAPGMSFWAEFFMVISAPFILFCQIIPSMLFNAINSLSEFIIAYSRSNPDAALLGWVGLIIGFLALGITLIYYIVLIFVISILFNNFMDKREYATSSPSRRKLQAYMDNRELTDQEKASQAFWENETLNLMGLTTNKDIIESSVSANEIARALRK